MARRPTRTDDWGFPRWRSYGSERGATKVRMCDRHGCGQAGDCPAPKAPNNPARWYFCEAHAAEYNRNWDYFQGLTPEEAAEREAQEQRDAKAYGEAKFYGWGGSGDGSRSRDEMHALDILELESDASFEDAKLAWRRVAKACHPDVARDDADAADRFRKAQAAFEVLRAAEDRRKLMNEGMAGN
jgi:hypothetical protein